MDDFYFHRANFTEAHERPTTTVERVLGRQGLELIAEVERLRRLEDLLLTNAERLESDPAPISKLLRWIEFNPRPGSEQDK